MTQVHLQALLPAPDGTGWYAVEPDTKTHVCSVTGCDNEAVAFHHATQGKSKIWRNRYRCADCLSANMTVRAGRVWQDNSVEMSRTAHAESTLAS